MPAFTFTLDLEDHRPRTGTGQRDNRYAKRYPHKAREILDFCTLNTIRGTIFTTGEVARDEPKLVRAFVDAGHEIACHSLDHTHLDQQSPDVFRTHTLEAKQVLEDVSGQAVAGYRAPVFSLTRETVWAIDILGDLGFTYSSSVLPAGNPLHAFPDAPRHPFRWANGLLEWPAPVAAFGPATLPYLGGFYFRYLPFNLIRVRALEAAEGGWLYFHPYDFDPDERFFPINEAPLWVSALLWFNRRTAFKKLQKFVDMPGIEFANPLGERLRTRDTAPLWLGYTTVG